MLTMLGWASAPHPFPKKAQVKPQQVGPPSPVERRSMKGLIVKLLQNFVLGTPRASALQSYSTAHTSPTFSYSVSGSYVLGPPSYSYAGHPAGTSPTAYAQQPSHQYGQPHAPPAPLDRAPSVHQGRASTSPTDGRNPFKIYPSSHNPLAAFIYERSEDARSDTMTSYSSSTGDSSSIYSSTTTTSSTMSQMDYGRDPRRQSNTSPLAGPSRDGMAPSVPPQAPHRPPVSLPPSSNSSVIVRESSNLRGAEAPLTYSSPPGRGPDPSRRRGSGSSDSDDAAMRASRPNLLRKSPPRIDSNVQFPDKIQRDGYMSDNHDYRVGYSRVASGMATPGPSREAPPLHRDDSYIDMQRSRRLSGVLLPPGIREHTSPVEAPGHDFRAPLPSANAVVLRNAPSRDRSYFSNIPTLESPRDRTSPDRDRFPAEPIRERRMSIAGSPTEMSGYFDRPALGRRSSLSSRGHPSPPEELPRMHASQPIPIRARTLSKSEILRGLREPDVAIIGVEPIAPRTVRFSENLICPSPIPREKRRKGWFNKRGDQLWTNDGGYVRPESIGEEYPPELAEYPDPGSGWMNEEGIRIDIEHRLIPKVPLRPALKRSSMSGSSPCAMLPLSRPENHAYYTKPIIREEI